MMLYSFHKRAFSARASAGRAGVPQRKAAAVRKDWGALGSTKLNELLQTMSDANWVQSPSWDQD